MVVGLLTLLLMGEPDTSRTFGAPEAFCRIQDTAINESSGIAASPSGPGVFYTHNDSGDSARFFRFDKAGSVTGIFSLKGVTAVDWEDMASAKVGGASWLYFGDIGDNARVRKSISVHRVKEPNGPSHEISSVETFTLVYPDKARDCEALIVWPDSGDITLITKARDNETVVYTLKAPSRPGRSTLTKLAVIDVNTGGIGGKWVTGADVSPDGKHVIVRTYTGALEYDVPRNRDDWVKSSPRSVALASEGQGEAICFSVDGSSILTTSEGSPCVVSRVPVTKGRSSRSPVRAHVGTGP